MASPSFGVNGTVCVKNGKAVITLGPNNAQDGNVSTPRPTALSILERVENGDLTVHPSRLPLLKNVLSNMMNTIQRQLLLQGGVGGVWTPECQSRLEKLLAKPHANKAKTLAIEDSKDKGQALAIEDSQGQNQAMAIEESKDDSSGSSSDSSSYSADSRAADLKLVKAQVQEQAAEAKKWKDEFENIFSALSQLSFGSRVWRAPSPEVKAPRRGRSEFSMAAPLISRGDDGLMKEEQKMPATLGTGCAPTVAAWV
eukprot:Skav222483  [mRNA]  locus=scaffold242:379763:382335:+ [translate_table: standard]